MRTSLTYPSSLYSILNFLLALRSPRAERAHSDLHRIPGPRAQDLLRLTCGLALSFLLLSCAPGSSGGEPAQHAPAAGAQTKQVTLTHGLGFLCATFGQSPELIFCWASEQAALDDGNAARIGLTSLTPVLMYAAPGVTTFSVFDHGVCFAGTCFGDSSSASAVTSESVTCEITQPSTLICPEANSVLTFPGLILSWLGPDLRIRHYPHSPTWYFLRSLA